MATDYVAADPKTGKAPQGLPVGTLVKTDGGVMWRIDSVNENGTYNTTKLETGGAPATPPSNTPTGGGQVSAGQGASVTHGGQGDLFYDSATGRITRTLGGVRYPVDPGEEKYASIYAEAQNRGVIPNQIQIPEMVYPDTSAELAELKKLMAQMGQSQYNPIDVKKEMAENTMSWDDAVARATSMADAYFQKAYEDSAIRGAQNLDRAGLYNSSYGQGLLAEAQRDIDRDKASYIGQLAQSIKNNDWQQVAQILQMTVNENQFGANYQQNAMSNAASLAINYIDVVTRQAQATNDYNLQAAGLQLQQQSQNIQNQYTQGLITQTQLENELTQIQIKAAQLDYQNASKDTRSASGYIGSGYDDPIDGDPDYATIMADIKSGKYGYLDAISVINLSAKLSASERESLINAAYQIGKTGSSGYYDASRVIRQQHERDEEPSNMAAHLVKMIEEGIINEEEAGAIARNYGLGKYF